MVGYGQDILMITDNPEYRSETRFDAVASQLIVECEYVSVIDCGGSLKSRVIFVHLKERFYSICTTF
jgi:hypothetical protein